MVEVDAGDDAEGGVGGGGGAEDAEVGAHIGADPVAGQVLGVGEDGRPLPRLQGNVGLPEPRVGEPEPGIDHDGAAGGAISGLGHRREGEGAEGAAQQQQEEPTGRRIHARAHDPTTSRSERKRKEGTGSHE